MAGTGTPEIETLPPGESARKRDTDSAVQRLPAGSGHVETVPTRKASRRCPVDSPLPLTIGGAALGPGAG